ncbi:unnamed protein product [Staurois parvus]|uniref:Uncharacterized protein n=1 Tax=Staurois parvus TaxID=386267 RepID=A0ABN9ANQ9_9NEOB|nr:unnamed protein product [Staurois parvus]
MPSGSVSSKTPMILLTVCKDSILKTTVRAAFFSLTTNVSAFLPTGLQCKEHFSH